LFANEGRQRLMEARRFVSAPLAGRVVAARGQNAPVDSLESLRGFVTAGGVPAQHLPFHRDSCWRHSANRRESANRADMRLGKRARIGP
jgi:hypothetical protein